VADENEPGYPPVPEQGEAYEYTMPSGGWKSMTQTAELTANNPSSEDVHLGSSVAVSGGTIVVGDPEQAVGGHGAAGAAYVFAKPAGEWMSTHQNAELSASDPNPGNDHLAYSVAVSGNTIVAGAPFHKVGANNSQGAAYVFVMPAGGWVNETQSAELTATDGSEPDELGYSVAVSGATVVAGARKHQVTEYADQGAAYVFTEPVGGWSGSLTQVQELAASDGRTSDSFGESIAISGNTILAGAPRHLASAGAKPHEAGAAYVFEAPLPTIKKLSPKKGTTAGGTKVTITGTNFTGVTAVKFGSADATIDSSTGTSITVETPAEAAATVAVSVTTESGTSAPSSKARFKFEAPKK
jgi:IPT/TIG domain/FG-GAP repeat